MRPNLLILFIVLLCQSTLLAQVPERFPDRKETRSQEESQSADENTGESEENFWDKVVFGGNAGLSVGTNSVILLAPSMGYKFTDRFIAGAGFVYLYLNIKRYYNISTQRIENANLESHTYGPKFFTSFQLIPELIYVGSQFEYLNHDVPVPDPNGFIGYEKRWTPVLWLEAGYVQNIGKKGAVQFGLKYNVLHDYDSPYGTAFFPVVSFFF